MKHSKNLKPGFSFIEIMIAMIIFAIFGTSLFQVQAFIFSNTAKAHNKTMYLLKSSQVMAEFQLQKFNTLKENKSIDTLVIQQKFQDPETSISLTVKSIPEKSSLFKDFAHAAKIIEQLTTIDNKQDKMISFTYSPPKAKDEKEQP